MADFGSSKNPNSKLFIEQKGLSKQSKKRNKFCPISDEMELRAFFLSPSLLFLFLFFASFFKRERKRGKGRAMATKKYTEFRLIQKSISWQYFQFLTVILTVWLRLRAYIFCSRIFLLHISCVRTRILSTIIFTCARVNIILIFNAKNISEIMIFILGI